MHCRGLQPFGTEQGSAHGAFGRIQVVFQQCRRKIQRVTVVVEPVSRRVRRELVRGANVHTQQVRKVLLYSARFSRRAVTCPASCGITRSCLSNSDSSQRTTALVASAAGRGTPGG